MPIVPEEFYFSLVQINLNCFFEFLPTPAPAKFEAAGHPKPPAPMIITLASLRVHCPLIPTHGSII